MKYLLSFILYISCLHPNQAQEYFSKRFDAGNTNFYNRIKTIINENDTLYYVAYNVCNYTDSTATDCSTIGKMDKYGNIIQERPFDWLSPVGDTKPMVIDDNKLIIVDGDGWYEESKISMLILDKFNLDSIAVYEYDIGEEMFFYAASGVIAYKDYYIISGWSRLANEDIWPDWCLWIDKNTMELDTITSYPFEKESAKIEFLFEETDGLLTVYFSGIALYPNSIGILLSSRGFIKYNEDKEVVFHYLDSIDLSTAHDYPHAAALLENGNMVYKQDYDSNEQGTFPTYQSDFDILCINPLGEIEWRFNKPGWSPYGRKSIYSISETENGDIIGNGRIDWHFNYPTLFELEPFVDTLPAPPDTFQWYQSPYIIKLDGETGEMIWQYALIDLEESGFSSPLYLSELYELSDGSLMGGGGYAIRDENGSFESYDSWVVRLPQNGCLLEDMDCEFESYLTDTEDIILIDVSDDKRFILYPNPTSNTLYLKDKTSKFDTFQVNIRSISGQLVKKQVLDCNEIDLTGIQQHTILIIEILNDSGKILQVEKVIKM